MNSHRLFFALWPDEVIRQQIKMSLPRGVSNIPPDKWHVTLRFLANCPNSHLQCLLQTPKTLPLEHFVLTLNRLGFWSRARITWLATDQIPKQLVLMLRYIDELIESCNLPKVEDKRDFFPHITLARRSKAPQFTLDSQVNWPIEGVSLIESQQIQGRYVYTKKATWHFLN